jgi:hypothetical protein
MSEQILSPKRLFPSTKLVFKAAGCLALTFAPDVLRHLSLHIIVIATAPYICTTTCSD